MGCYRTCPPVLSWTNLLRPQLLLPRWFHLPCYWLVDQQEVPQQRHPLHQVCSVFLNRLCVELKLTPPSSSSSFPVIFSGTGLIPPASAVNYVPWAIVGFLFNFVIRRRHFSWWTKYNYVLSAALDSGVAVSVVVIFFCLQFPKNGGIGVGVQNWWGNTVPFGTADAKGTPMYTLKPGDTFG